MKNDIFISYSRHDTNVVNEIVNMLEQEGYSVWIDRDGIESGEDFKRVILKAIKESEVVLFFSSEHSNASEWTAKEIGVAVKYRKHTIPIKLDDSNFNEAVEFDLINLDYIDYSKPTIRPAMREKLLKTLRNKLGPRNKEIERLEAERKAKEAAERLESERKAEQQRAEAKRKAEEARRKAEQERLERERAEAQRKPQLAQTDPKTPNPKLKKILWIGIGAAAALALLLVLLLKPKKDPAPTDPDTLAFQACQTVADYRDYMRDYGRNALHYADARSFVDRYVADSMAKEQQLLAQQQAQQQAEADAKALAEVEKKEDAAYKKCTTIAACDSYLKAYPQGRYVAEVTQKKAELEKNAPKNGSHNGHDYVDLGLPSGTLWATCNVGASSPEDYGNYYAWGETSTKSTYNWDTYKYANGNYDELTKYCNKSDYGNNGFTDNLTQLQSGDDAATSAWGSGWRTPSKTQWDELLKNTTNKWTTQNGKKGGLFTSKKNGQTLFLPAAGCRYDGSLGDVGSDGYYWSSTLYAGRPNYAWNFYFRSDDYGVDYNSRLYGRSVRPVRSARQN